MASSRNKSTSTISKNVFVKPTIYNRMNFYPDMFDILDHDDETENHMDETQIYKRIEEEFNLDYQFDNTQQNMEEEEEEEEEALIENDNDDETSEEQVLSQRLSQLSATDDYEREPSVDDRKRRRLPLTTSESMTKKTRPNINDVTNNDPIPYYLLPNNKLFDRMIQEMIDPASTIDRNDLRQIAFFIHQIARFNTWHALWSAYLRSGIGSLKEEQEEEIQHVSMIVDRRFWSNEVKSIIKSKKADVDEQIACENVVHQHLRDYHEKIEHYEKQLELAKQRLIHWTPILEEAIQTFVHQYGITPLHMKYDYKIATLTYQYEDQILQRQYQQQNPTDYQIKVARSLYDVKWKLETTKCTLMEYRRRVLCNKPPKVYNSLQISLPSSIDTLSDFVLRQQFINRHRKLIQQTQTDLMAIYITAMEAKRYQYQIIFREETATMWRNHDNHIENKEMTETLLRLISKRTRNINEKFNYESNFTNNYSIRSSYDLFTNIKKDTDGEETMKRIGFSPSLIIDPMVTKAHYLSDQQLQLLNRGPTYVAPGQMHVSSLFQTMDDMISKQYAPLKHQFAVLFDKYRINISRQINFYKDADTGFKKIYSVPIPSDIQQRAVYEKKLIQSIRYYLKTNNLILRRTADHNNVFYLGNMKEFTEASNQYVKNIDRYTVLMNTNEMDKQQIQNQLNKKVESMNKELNDLYVKKKITITVLKTLQVKTDQAKLPYLYFLPNVFMTNSIQVTPMIAAHGSATAKIAHFVYEVLQPFVASHMQSTTFVNEADFIRKFHHYTNVENRLHPTTLFATIKITNYYNTDSHKHIVDALGYFVGDRSATNKLQYASITQPQPVFISVTTIQELVKLFLKNNVFYYNEIVYEFTRGGPNSLLLTEMLSNIYIAYWQPALFADTRLKNELHGRYKDEFFFTWNRSKEELMTFIETVKEKHPHVHLATSIDRCIHFLNTQIENRSGHLYTCVYHHPQMQKYTLPYVIGHAKLNHCRWFRSALIRAVRLCSHYVDFIQEEMYLEMTCLANGYSTDFIETQLRHFYIRFNVEKIRFCLDQTVYQRLRYRLFDFTDTQRTISEKNQELEDKELIFRFSYLYDYGAYNQFNSEFHETWKKYLTDDPQFSGNNMKAILNAKLVYSLNACLAQQKLSSELLKTVKQITF